MQLRLRWGATLKVDHIFILVDNMIGTTNTFKAVVDTGAGQILCHSVVIMKHKVLTCLEAKPRFISEKYHDVAKNVTVNVNYM